MIYWHIVRDKDGKPLRLEWDSAWQKACEKRAAEIEAEERRRKESVIPSMAEMGAAA